MRRNLWIAAAAALVGTTLGAGVGVVAGSAVDDDPARVGRMAMPMAAMGDYESMDAMHAAMPEGLAEQCDAMHASMPEGMRTMDPGAMGQMGPMMGGAGMGPGMGTGMGGAGMGPGSMPGNHAEHHR